MGRSCLICLEELSAKPGVLGCDHAFCYNCLAQAAKQGIDHTCPLCRAEQPLAPASVAIKGMLNSGPPTPSAHYFPQAVEGGRSSEALLKPTRRFCVLDPSAKTFSYSKTWTRRTKAVVVLTPTTCRLDVLLLSDSAGPEGKRRVAKLPKKKKKKKKKSGSLVSHERRVAEGLAEWPALEPAIQLLCMTADSQQILVLSGPDPATHAAWRDVHKCRRGRWCCLLPIR